MGTEPEKRETAILQDSLHTFGKASLLNSCSRRDQIDNAATKSGSDTAFDVGNAKRSASVS